MATASTLPGRQLTVKWDTKCPTCGGALTRGASSWYIHKNDSKSKKSELYCTREHAAQAYGTSTAPAAPEPVAIVPEKCGAWAANGAWTCTLPLQHDGDHVAHRSDGTVAHEWNDDELLPVVIVSDEPEPAETVLVNGEDLELTPGVYHKQLGLVIDALEAGEHVFLVGPAGTGKSTLGRQAHELLRPGKVWGSCSFGPTTPTSKLLGYNDANGNTVRTPFWDCYEAGSLFLGDELDNGHPGLTAELNQALANGCAAFASGVVDADPGFRFIATGNTYGRGGDRLFVGRNQLDAATLDRFCTINVEVDEALEERLVREAAPTATDEALVALGIVRRAREVAFDTKTPVVVSPRASIGIARLLERGRPLPTCLDLRLRGSWSDEVCVKLGVSR